MVVMTTRDEAPMVFEVSRRALYSAVNLR